MNEENVWGLAKGCNEIKSKGKVEPGLILVGLYTAVG